MTPSVSVCLITCERYEYTRVTVESFARYNDLTRFQLLHADDASTDGRIREVANAFGFRTVSSAHRRSGNMATIRSAVDKADGAWILLLENDWESVRAFPWDSFAAVAESDDVYALRLCGPYKERRETRPFANFHAGKDNAPVIWKTLAAGLEVGDAHWGHTPTATRAADARWLLSGARREKDARLKSGRIDRLMARVTENVFFHIGNDRTPDFQR